MLKVLRKKMLAFGFATMMLANTIIAPTNVLAAQVQPGLQLDTKNKVEYQELSKKYSISEEEIENLDVNLKVAIDKINEQNKKGNKNASVKVSENLILQQDESVVSEPVKLHSVDSITLKRAAYNRTVTSRLNLKNRNGKTVVTLLSTGVFYTNGKVSRPIDAYGSYSGLVWKLSNKSSAKGSQAYNAWVRNSFSGELNIGIDPLHVTIQTFSTSGTVYCDANGSTRSYWN